MEIVILNKRNTEHCICRLTGEQINIKPNGFYILNTQDDREINYWLHLNNNVLNRCGLEISINDEYIKNLKRTDQNTGAKAPTDVSIVDNGLSPMVQELAKITYAKGDEMEEDVSVSDTITSTTEPEFTEEELLNKSKEELCQLCDNFNISYRKNASVKTLVNLIIGSGVL